MVDDMNFKVQGFQESRVDSDIWKYQESLFDLQIQWQKWCGMKQQSHERSTIL